MRKSIIFILLFCWGCLENVENAPLIHDDLYYECLSDPFCQYNWQLAEMKVLSGDTLVFQFEPKRLYFDLVKQGAISDKKQFAAYLKRRISNDKLTEARVHNGKYNIIGVKCDPVCDRLSKQELFAKYIGKDGYINELSLPDENLPGLLLRLQELKILVHQESYSGKLKVYEPSEAWKRIKAEKANLPQ